MQFGISSRVLSFGYRFLSTMILGMLHIQLPQYGQAPGAEPGQRQSCDVNDPACQGNSQERTPPHIGSTVSNSTTGQFRPRNDVKLSEPDVDWSNAVVERQARENLTISLLPFNLGSAVLEGDELLPGDAFKISSKRDTRVPQSQRTRFGRLDGEFISSGVYIVRLGRFCESRCTEPVVPVRKRTCMSRSLRPGQQVASSNDG